MLSTNTTRRSFVRNALLTTSAFALPDFSAAQRRDLPDIAPSATQEILVRSDVDIATIRPNSTVTLPSIWDHASTAASG